MSESDYFEGKCDGCGKPMMRWKGDIYMPTLKGYHSAACAAMVPHEPRFIRSDRLGPSRAKGEGT